MQIAELGKRSQNLDLLALLRSFRPDPSARALPLIFQGSPERYPLALSFAHSARAFHSFLLLPLPFPLSALRLRSPLSSCVESGKREARAESVSGERRARAESRERYHNRRAESARGERRVEERTLNLEIPLPALCIFFFWFWHSRSSVPNLEFRSEQKRGGVELGEVLPSSGK